MIDRGVARAIRLSDTERDSDRYLVSDVLEILARVLLYEPVGANCSVAAGDVISDSRYGDMVPVRRDPADRHHVPGVPVGHQRCICRVRRNVLQLAESFLVVLAENRRYLPGTFLGHGPVNFTVRARRQNIGGSLSRYRALSV